MSTQPRFVKKYVFGKLTFFDLRNKTIPSEMVSFLLKVRSNKRNVVQHTFHGFADVSSYLSFNVSALERSCLYNIFSTTNATDFIEPISKSSYKV